MRRVHFKDTKLLFTSSTQLNTVSILTTEELNWLLNTIILYQHTDCVPILFPLKLFTFFFHKYKNLKLIKQPDATSDQWNQIRTVDTH